MKWEIDWVSMEGWISTGSSEDSGPSGKGTNPIFCI
jgi:hypothetical protein